MSFFTHPQEVSHARPESASSTPSYDDDDDEPPPPLPLTNTQNTKNNDQYSLWEPHGVQPYPSPPQLESNPSRNIPLPVPPLASFEDSSVHGADKFKFTGHGLTTEPRDHQVKFYHAGGVLDSPIVYYNHHASPLSPPPTLPTSTAALPSSVYAEGLGDDNDLSAWLDSGFGGGARNPAVSLPATHSATSEPHLLSPLSPEFITSIAGIHRQHIPSAVAETGDDSSSFPSPSEPMGLDLDAFMVGSGSDQDVEMRPTLDEGTGSWSGQSFYTLSDSDFDEQDGDLTPTYPHSPHYRRGLNHTFYPSPDISPEQSIIRPSPYPCATSPSMSDMWMQDSQRERRSNVNDGVAHRSDLDYNCDYNRMDYHADLLGSQSPSVRTLGLPELDDEDDEMDLGLGLSNFASFPMSTFEQEDELSFSSLPSTPSSGWPSTSPDTSEIQSESTSTDEFSRLRLDLSSSPSSAGLLLLDPESESDAAAAATRSPSLSPPSSLSSSISDDSPSSLSLSESLESLDSRLFILPSLLGTGEYPTLDSHPELVGDLNRLMELRRKTQSRVKELECKLEKRSRLGLDSGSSSGSGSSSSLKDRAVDDGREVEGKNVILRRVALAQTQNEKGEARAMRKREKERWKEIGALVQLTVLGGREKVGQEEQSRSKSKSAVAEAKVVTETVTRDPAIGLSEVQGGEQAHFGSAFAKKDKKKVSITNMAQLVARMVLRRRDYSYSPSTSRPVSYVSRPARSGGLISSPPSGTRRYAKSPLWQSMAISYEDDTVSSECEGNGATDGVPSEGLEEDDDDDDDDDLGLGIGLRLRGFGDFGAPGS